MRNDEVYDAVLRIAKRRKTATMLVDGEPHLTHISRRPQDGDGGVFRFVGNPITKAFEEAASGEGQPWRGAYDLNKAMIDYANGKYTTRDMRRFAIEIGYSVSGFLSLSYCSTAKFALPIR